MSALVRYFLRLLWGPRVAAPAPASVPFVGCPLCNLREKLANRGGNAHQRRLARRAALRALKTASA